jgi:hypothetical protein
VGGVRGDGEGGEMAQMMYASKLKKEIKKLHD